MVTLDFTHCRTPDDVQRVFNKKVKVLDEIKEELKAIMEHQ